MNLHDGAYEGVMQQILGISKDMESGIIHSILCLRELNFPQNNNNNNTTQKLEEKETQEEFKDQDQDQQTESQDLEKTHKEISIKLQMAIEKHNETLKKHRFFSSSC